MENCIVAGNYEPCHQLSMKLGRSSKGPARSYVKNFLPAVMGFACNHADRNPRANVQPAAFYLRIFFLLLFLFVFLRAEPLMRWNSGWTHEQWEDRRDLIRSVRSNMLMKQRCDGGKISTKLLLSQLSEFFHLFVESLLLQSTPRSSLCDKLVVILLLSCRV